MRKIFSLVEPSDDSYSNESRIALQANRMPIRVMDVYNVDRAAKELHMHRAELINGEGRYQNSIVCTEGPCVDGFRQRGIDVDTIPIARELSPKKMMASVQELAALFEKRQPTIVHSHGSTAGACARLAARQAGVPYVVHTVHGFHFHEFMSALGRRVFIHAERFLARYTDVLLFQNQEDLDEAARHGIRASRANLKVGNGIHWQQYASLQLAPIEEIPVLLMIARFEPVKNQDMLIRAAHILMKRGVSFQLWFAGGGPRLDYCKQLSDQLGLGNRAHFMGYVNDVRPLVAQASVSVLTSLKEGIPRGLLEPMAAGIPVVATDVKGNRETVIDGKTGMLVPLNDVRVLADVLQRLIEENTLRRQLGRESAAWVRDNFDESKVVNRLVSIYDSLTSPIWKPTPLIKKEDRINDETGERSGTAKLQEAMTLKQIADRCHREKRSQPAWHYVHRRLSLPLTWLLFRMPVSPNFVSAMMLVLGIVGSALLVPVNGTINIVGFVCYYLAFLMDKVDGDLARLRGQVGPRGMIVDHAYHRLTMFVFFTAMGIHYYLLTSNVYGLCAAMVSGFLANYLQDAQVYPYRLYSQYLIMKGESWQLRSLPEPRRLIRRELWMKPLKMFKSEPTVCCMAVLLYVWPSLLFPFFMVSVSSLFFFVCVQHIILFRDGTEAELAYIDRLAAMQASELLEEGAREHISDSQRVGNMRSESVELQDAVANQP